MANPNFQAIIDRISYEQVDSATNPNFKLKKGAPTIFNSDDLSDLGIISYINSTTSFTKSSFSVFLENLSKTDAEYRDFVDQVTRKIRAASTFLYDFIKNPSAFKSNQVASAAYIDTTTGKYPILTFLKDYPIKVLDTGIGQDLKWAKIYAYIKVDGVDASRVCYCLLEDIVPASDNPKILPDYSSIFPLDPEKRQKMTARSLFDTTNFDNTNVDEIFFDESTACYGIIRETDIVDFTNITDAEIEENFKKYFSGSIARILKNANKQILKNEKTLEENYYLYGKINGYRISPRPRQGVKILVSVPYRNVTLADNTLKETIRDVFTSPLAIQSIADTLSGKEIFDFSKYAPGISDALSGGPNAGEQIDYVQATFGENPALKEKVSAAEIRTTLDRKVYIPLKDYEKSFDMFQKVLETIDNRLKKDLEGKEDTEIFINLSDYVQTFKSARTSIKKLLKDNGLFPVDSSDDTLLTLRFDEGVLSEFLITGNDGTVVSLIGGQEIAQNQPFNDFTFASLLNNFNAIKKEDGEKVSYQEFFSNYILPEDLAKIKLGNSEEDAQNTELSCLRSHASLLKDQLKQNTNEFLNNIISGETIKNTKADLDKKEWQKTLLDEVGNDLNNLFDMKKNRFFDPHTIDWDAIIDQFTQCITDKESAEMWRILLGAIKNKLLNDTPIACSIPVFRLPKFPVFKLPIIPNLPSITTNYYDQFANSLVEARESVIKAIVKGVMEALDFCDMPANPSDIGATSPEDIADYGQNNQALANALSDGSGYVDQSLIEETKLTLQACSEVLTKQELVQLMLGISNDQVLQLVKKEIIRLSSVKEQKISILPEKVGTFKDFISIPDSVKTKTYFARLSKTLKQDILESLNEQTYSTNPDLLCIDNTLLDNNLKHALMNKGLDEEAALEDIRRRREEARRKIAALGATLTLLERDSVQGQPANCIKNPDGSVTPGISDKLGRPEAFEIASNNTINALYKPYDENYDSEFHNFFDRATEVTNTYNDLDILVSSSYDFIKTPKKNFKDNLKISINSADGVLSSQLPSYRVGENKNEYGYLASMAFLSDLQVVSNDIDVKNRYTFTISGSEILSSSITNDVASSNKFNTAYLPDSQVYKIRDSHSYKSEVYVESTPVVSGVFPPTSGNMQVNTHTYVVNNNSYIEGFYADHIAENYTKLIKNRFENNVFFKNLLDTNPFTGETSGKNETPIISKFKLNPLVPENKKKCGTKFDKRLINILYSLKDEINEASRKSSCFVPKIGSDGKKSEPSPVDIANKFAAVKMLLRIYAIDFNFKLIGFGFIPSLMNSATFYNTCYTIFSNDLKKLFGNKFTDKVFSILVEKYILDEGIILPLPSINYSSINDYRVKAFIKYFKDDQIKDTNNHIKELLYADSLYLDNIDSNRAGDKANIQIANNSYIDLLDFEYNNLNKNNLPFIEKNIKEITENLAPYANMIEESLNNVLDILKPVLSYTRLGGVGLRPEEINYNLDTNIENCIKIIRKTRVIGSYISDRDGFVTAAEENALISDLVLNKILPKYNDFISQFSSPPYVLLYDEQSIIDNLKPQLNLYYSNIDVYNGLSKTKQQYEQERLTQSNNIDNEYMFLEYGDNYISLKTSLKKTLEMTINEYRNKIYVYSETITSDVSEQDFLQKIRDLQSLLETEEDTSYIFKRNNIDPNTYDYKKDVEMKKSFDLFFRYLLPLEELYSNQMSALLLSLSSIGTINESYNLIKQNARQVLSIIELAEDYTRSPFDNGIATISSALKAAAAVPEFMIKAQAELIDPNVAVASFFSKMYGLGVVSAASVGVDVPVKKLPLYVTSPLVPLPFSFPVTPPGIIAVAASFKDLSKDTKKNIGNEDNKDSCEEK